MTAADTQIKDSTINITTTLVSMKKITDDEKDLAIARAGDIDITDDLSIANAGKESQEKLRMVTSELVNGIKNQDTGPIGEIMSEALLTIRGLDPKILNEDNPGFMGRMVGRVKPVVKFMQRYESIAKQVNVIVNKLDTGRVTLDTNVEKFNNLGVSLIEYYRGLMVDIASIEYKINEVEKVDLVNANKIATKSGDLLDAQNVDVIRKKLDYLERRRMNLEQSLQVTMQAIPTIKIINDNNLNLIQKVGDIINHTVPLWQTQMALALGIIDQMSVMKLSRGVTDMNSAMIEENAKLLQTTNREIRTEIDRGLFDIESIEKANQTIIDTIQDSITMSSAAKITRTEITARLNECEENLKRSLLLAAKFEVDVEIIETK